MHRCGMAFLVLGLASLAIACGRPKDRIFLPAPFGCSSDRVQAYIDDVAGRAISASAPHRISMQEAATVFVRLSANGSVLSSKLHKATSARTAQWALEAIRTGAPYPRPLPSVSRCVVAKPFMVVLVSLGPESGCDEKGTLPETDPLEHQTRVLLGDPSG